MKHHVLSQIWQKRQEMWSQLPVKRLQAIKPDVTQRWDIESFQNRRDEVVIARVRIGHTNMRI